MFMKYFDIFGHKIELLLENTNLGKVLVSYFQRFLCWLSILNNIMHKSILPLK